MGFKMGIVGMPLRIAGIFRRQCFANRKPFAIRRQRLIKFAILH